MPCKPKRATCKNCGDRKFTTFKRGLCESCYQRLRYNGTLEQNADARLYDLTQIGDRHLCDSGYVTLKTVDGTVWEHRHVMEQMLDRKLIVGETIHHKNNIKCDNAPKNLELWFGGQPNGARVSDLIAYLVEYHRSDVIAALERWHE